MPEVTPEKPESVDSTSDERTTNNSMRHQYRVLSADEKALMARVKDVGAWLVSELHKMGGTDPSGDKFASRDLSLANTHIEDAVMRVVRHITK